MRADVQKPDLRRERRASGQRIAKPLSIKDAKRKSGGRAWKAVELTSGGLPGVLRRTGNVVRRSEVRGRSQQRA